MLAAFEDCLVVVGGWVPDLLLEQADEPHVGSIDVDLALDANKLADGRYADLLKLLLDSGRYKPGAKPFQLVVEVDLKDGAKPVEVEVEFLAPKEVKLKKNRPKLLEGFRVLQANGCGTAFHAPVRLEVSGRTVRGANNKVHLRIASLPDFLVMKAPYLGRARQAQRRVQYSVTASNIFQTASTRIGQRLEEPPQRKDVARAIEILRDKFASVDAFGPGQVVEFQGSVDAETQAMQARRAFELMQQFLSYL